MSSVLENALYIRADLNPSHRKQMAVANSTPARELFATQLLLYDTVFIPTNDFAILPVLLHWCGLDGLRSLLNCGALGFVRPNNLLCYMGGGAGLAVYKIDENQAKAG